MVAQTVENLPAMQETQFQSLGWEDLLEKRMATHSSILAWRIHGQRSLAGFGPWGGKESDTTEPFSLLTILVALMCVFWGRGSAFLNPVRFQELRTDPRP